MSRVIFDGRHRWGDEFVEDGRFRRTCRVCGLTRGYETIISRALENVLIDQLTRPNIYRAIVRTTIT